jgi:class 3 adenylate cyclase
MISDKSGETERHLSQLRLLLEELCCDLCLFDHVAEGTAPPERIVVDREVPLEETGAFADIRVTAPGQAPYFVEIKYAYTREQIRTHLRRKYGRLGPESRGASRVVVVVDADDETAEQELKPDLREQIHPSLEVQLWTEARLRALIRQRFGVEVRSISEEDLLEARVAIDRAKGFYAFGGQSPETYVNDPLRSELLFHFDFWRLRQLREAHSLAPQDILRTGAYDSVAVVLSDLCSFSGYVRDTPEQDLIRHCLTSFYSKARYEIIKKGGMLYQIIGDSVVGLFGIPDRRADSLRDALLAARGLMSVSASVSHHWQRHIDHLQPASGCRIGIALGDLQIVSYRPFSRTHIGAISDAINIAARLQKVAEPNEVVVSNTFYSQLDPVLQAPFREMEPVEAHNLGRIRAWKLPA